MARSRPGRARPGRSCLTPGCTRTPEPGFQTCPSCLGAETFHEPAGADTCAADGCNHARYVFAGVMSRFCDRHVCQAPMCMEPREDRSELCAAHRCPVAGCVEMKSRTAARCDTHSSNLVSVGCARCHRSSTDGGPFCRNCRCTVEGCDRVPVPTGSGSPSPFCLEHICAEADCLDRAAGDSRFCPAHRDVEEYIPPRSCWVPFCVREAEEGSNFCRQCSNQEHRTCLVAECTRTVRPGTVLCDEHRCVVEGCGFRRHDGHRECVHHVQVVEGPIRGRFDEETFRAENEFYNEAMGEPHELAVGPPRYPIRFDTSRPSFTQDDVEREAARIRAIVPFEARQVALGDLRNVDREFYDRVVLAIHSQTHAVPVPPPAPDPEDVYFGQLERMPESDRPQFLLDLQEADPVVYANVLARWAARCRGNLFADTPDVVPFGPLPPGPANVGITYTTGDANTRNAPTVSELRDGMRRWRESTTPAPPVPGSEPGLWSERLRRRDRSDFVREYQSEWPPPSERSALNGYVTAAISRFIGLEEEREVARVRAGDVVDVFDRSRLFQKCPPGEKRRGLITLENGQLVYRGVVERVAITFLNRVAHEQAVVICEGVGRVDAVRPRPGCQDPPLSLPCAVESCGHAHAANLPFCLSHNFQNQLPPRNALSLVAAREEDLWRRLGDGNTLPQSVRNVLHADVAMLRSFRSTHLVRLENLERGRLEQEARSRQQTTEQAEREQLRRLIEKYGVPAAPPLPPVEEGGRRILEID